MLVVSVPSGAHLIDAVVSYQPLGRTRGMTIDCRLEATPRCDPGAGVALDHHATGYAAPAGSNPQLQQASHSVLQVTTAIEVQ